MPFRYLDRHESCRGEKRLGLGVEALTVLHRTGRVIGDTPVTREGNIRPFGKAKRRSDLGNIASEQGDPRGLFGIGTIPAHHEAVVFYGRAATRSIDDDGIQPSGEPLSFPDLNVGASEGQRRRLPPEVMDESPAATLTDRRHDFAAMAGQQTNRRLVDFWSEHPLYAALQQGNPHAPCPFGRKDLWSIHGRDSGYPRRCERG